MGCKYTYGELSFDSYKELIDYLSNNLDAVNDLLFSKVDKQDVTYKKLDAIKTENIQKRSNGKFSSQFTDSDLSDENVHEDGSAELTVSGNNYSLQSFIDTLYRDSKGNPIMPILKVADFLKRKIAFYVKTMSEEAAELKANLLVKHWKIIAKDGRDFHKIIMRLRKDGTFRDVIETLKGTSFAHLAEKLNPNSDESIYNEIHKQVRIKNSRESKEFGVSEGSRIIKNIDLAAELQNMGKTIHAHVDYIAVKPDGSLDVYLIKSSHEAHEFWDYAKKEKYQHELALLYRIFQYNKINTNNIRFNIIPAIFKYNQDFSKIEDITIEPAKCYSHVNGAFVLQKQINEASRYIESNLEEIEVDTDTIELVNKQLKALFPEGNLKAQGMISTIKNFIDTNWDYWIQTEQPDQGYNLNIDGTIHHVDGNETGSANNQVIELISKIRFNLTESSVISARNLIQQIKNSRAFGFAAFGNPHLDELLSKYFEHTSQEEDGKTKYKYSWKIYENPDITDCNIIMFQNSYTDQIDIISLSELNINTKYKLNGQDNVLGFHVSDMYAKDLQGHELMKATYGNLDTLRVMFLLNAIASNLPSNIKLGNISVVGGLGKQVRSQTYPAQMIIPNFVKAVDVMSKVESLDLTNNLTSAKFISPTDILVQEYVSIMQKNTQYDKTSLGTLKDLIVGQDKEQSGYFYNVEGDALPSLQIAENTEVKIQRLEELIFKLQSILKSKNYPISVNTLANFKSIKDPEIKICAKLLSDAIITLDRLQGNIRIVDDDLSTSDKYLARPQNIANSQVRLVGKLLQDAIHTTASRMDPEVSQFVQDCLEYYKNKGYGKIENFFIGDQVRVFKNLYQDTNYELLFKNPYDNTNDLDSVDREFLKKVLKYINKFRFKEENFENKSEIEISNFIANHKQYLFVPLEKASGATRHTNAWANPVEYANDLSRRVKNYCLDSKKYFQEMVEGVITEEEIKMRDRDMEDLQAYNKFRASETQAGRQRLLKFGKNYFETNIENIVIDYIHKSIQEEEMNRMLLKTKGILLYLKLKGVDEGDPKKFENIIQYIDDYVTTSVYGKSIMSEDTQKLEAKIRPFRRIVTKAYIAANPTGFVRDLSGGFLSNMVRTATKYATDISPASVLTAYKFVLTTGSISTMNIDLLDKFNSKYLISNINIEQQQEGYKTNREGIMNSNWLYSTLKRPDFINRMVLFVARLIQDGSLSAYSVENGHLKYTWKNDKRFNLLANEDKSNPEEYNKQKALYLSLLVAFNKENPNNQLPVKLTQDLPDGYTLNQIEEIKNLGNTIYGAYSVSEKSGYEKNIIGQQFAVFSTWMNGIYDVYFGKRRESSYETEKVQAYDDNGNPLWIDENTGNITVEKTGVPYLIDIPLIVQGVFRTLSQAGKILFFRPNKWEAFKQEILDNKVNRRNLVRGVTDGLVWLIIAQIYRWFMDPAYKEHKKNADGNDFIANALIEILYKGSGSCYDEFKGPIPIIDYITNNTKPAAFQWQQKFINDTYQLTFGDKTFGEYVVGMHAFPRSMQDSYRMYQKANKASE